MSADFALALAMMSYCLLLLCGLLVRTVSTNTEDINGELVESMESPVNMRQLRAASLTSDLAKRGLEIPLNYGMTLHYLEGT